MGRTHTAGVAENAKEHHLRVALGSGESLEKGLKDRASVIIGRDASCDIIIHDAKASRKHCRLSRNGAEYLLEDLGSRNGTLVNGVKISGPMTLQHKQTFQIGDTMFFIGQ
ncbi:MAG TPA: FHA domain-containing protein [Methylomirabilota bacterium]|nr:FHA domain-containing protein [Methylomirabilota bacterium]